MKPEQVKEDFDRHIKDHTMKVHKDDGLYRHLEFSSCGSSVYRFDVMTWPGYVCICGDMGEWVFSRNSDMLAFFKEEKINLYYWAKKCDAICKQSTMRDMSKECAEEIIEQLKQELKERYASDQGLLSAALEQLESVDVDAWDARGFLEQIEALETEDKRGETVPLFYDVFEYDPTDYSFGFVWICYALMHAASTYFATKKID